MKPTAGPTGGRTAAQSGTVPCPDCGGTVSLRAPACIHCGRPLDDMGLLAQSLRSGTLQSEPPLASTPQPNLPPPGSEPASILPPPDPQSILAPAGSQPPPAQATRGRSAGSSSAPATKGRGTAKAPATAGKAAAKVPAGLGRNAAKLTRSGSAAALRNPLAVGSFGAVMVALLLSYLAYERGATLRGLVVAAAVIVLAWLLGSVANARAEKAGRRRSWLVRVSRLLALGSAALLGFAGYGYVAAVYL